MVSKRFLGAFILALAASALRAQSDPGTAIADEGPACYFRLDASGTPVFTQVLRWKADPNAFEYRIIMKDSSGADVLDERVTSSRVEVRLKPGAYEYRIISYNLLAKAEAESPWKNLEIAKAERPEIVAVFPKTLSLDSMVSRVTVRGSKLLDKGTIALISPSGRRYPGAIKERRGDRELVVVFPDEAFRPGTYTLYAENPGGLSTTVVGALQVRLQSPLDILASTGYAPLLALYDPWFVASWVSNFHPLGLDARLEFLFVKWRKSSVGLELGAEERRMSADFGEASLTSDFTLAGGGFLYAYRLTRQIRALARLGGGISWSSHNFDYQGYAGPTATSFDPFARAGIALQVFLPWQLYGEIGVDCSGIFLLNHNAVGITPSLRVGYQLY